MKMKGITKSGSDSRTTTETTTYTTTKDENKERKILDLIENNPYLSADELSRQVNLSQDGVTDTT